MNGNGHEKPPLFGKNIHNRDVSFVEYGSGDVDMLYNVRCAEDSSPVSSEPVATSLGSEELSSDA